MVLVPICVVAIATVIPAAVGEQKAKKELFRRDIGAGVQVVVTQEAMVPAEAIKPFLPPPPSEGRPSGIRTIGYFALCAELISESGTLRIWSEVQPVFYAGQWDSHEVLDLLALPDGRIAMVTAGGLGSIVVTDMSVAGPAKRWTLPGREWSELAAAVPGKPGRLGAKLSYDEKRGTVGVVVTDRAGSPPKVTRFEQKPGVWEFSRIEN
jgi:hypothetical protein